MSKSNAGSCAELATGVGDTAVGKRSRVSGGGRATLVTDRQRGNMKCLVTIERSARMGVCETCDESIPLGLSSRRSGSCQPDAV